MVPMDTKQCKHLREAYLKATKRTIRAIVVMGGSDFMVQWYTPINHIEQAISSTDES